MKIDKKKLFEKLQENYEGLFDAENEIEYYELFIIELIKNYKEKRNCFEEFLQELCFAINEREQWKSDRDFYKNEIKKIKNSLSFNSDIKIKIEEIDSGKISIKESFADCEDDIDFYICELVLKYKDIITIGKTIGSIVKE